MTETTNLATASGSKAGSTELLDLDDLVEMRKTLKALELAVMNIKQHIEEYEEQETPGRWASFNVERRKVTLPSEMLIELLKEISARASKEMAIIKQKFRDCGVDPCYSVDED